MDVALLSIVAGVLVAVPAMGPASAIVIRRILLGRERTGLAFAGGYILAEGLGCLAAIWGVDLLFRWAPFLKPVLAWAGMLVLAGVGVYFASGAGPTSRDVDFDASADASSLAGQFVFGFGLTAFNPALVAGWTTAITVALSTTGIELATWQKWFVPFGIVVGETLWYVLLIGAARRFEELLDEVVIDWFMRGVGVILIGLATWGAVRRLLAG